MSIIKAGTYRFNDVLSAPSGVLEQLLNFTSTVTTIEGDISVEANAVCYGIAWSEANEDYDAGLYFAFSSIDLVAGEITESVLSSSEVLPIYLEDTQTWNGVASKSPQYSDYFLGLGNTITIPTDQEVSAEFYAWFTANAVEVVEETPVATITYNGEVIASLNGGQKATLACAGMKMETDVVVEVAENVGGGSSGSCDKPHIIEVTELPTENIDENAVYSCGGSYWKYQSGEYSVILGYNGNGETGDDYDFATILVNNGFTIGGYHYATTKPTENIMVSNLESMTLEIYYIEDENTLYVYFAEEDMGWLSVFDIFGDAFSFDFIGAVSDASETTNLGYYFLGSAPWQAYILEPKGFVTVTESGTYNVTDKASVIVDIADAAIVGIWRFNENISLGDSNWEQEVSFTSVVDGTESSFIKMRFYAEALRYCSEDNELGSGVYGNNYGTYEWHNSNGRFVNFGTDPQLVNSWFKDWMTANATPIYTIVQTE